MLKLIAIDVDGTLLDSGHQLSDENKRFLPPTDMKKAPHTGEALSQPGSVPLAADYFTAIVTFSPLIFHSFAAPSVVP